MLEVNATPLTGATLVLLLILCIWWLIVEWGFKTPAVTNFKQRRDKSKQIKSNEVAPQHPVNEQLSHKRNTSSRTVVPGYSKTAVSKNFDSSNGSASINNKNTDGSVNRKHESSATSSAMEDTAAKNQGSRTAVEKLHGSHKATQAKQSSSSFGSTTPASKSPANDGSVKSRTGTGKATIAGNGTDSNLKSPDTKAAETNTSKQSPTQLQSPQAAKPATGQEASDNSATNKAASAAGTPHNSPADSEGIQTPGNSAGNSATTGHSANTAKPKTEQLPTQSGQAANKIKDPTGSAKSTDATDTSASHNKADANSTDATGNLPNAPQQSKSGQVINKPLNTGAKPVAPPNQEHQAVGDSSTAKSIIGKSSTLNPKEPGSDNTETKQNPKYQTAAKAQSPSVRSEASIQIQTPATHKGNSKADSKNSNDALYAMLNLEKGVQDKADNSDLLSRAKTTAEKTPLENATQNNAAASKSLKNDATDAIQKNSSAKALTRLDNTPSSNIQGRSDSEHKSKQTPAGKTTAPHNVSPISVAAKQQGLPADRPGLTSVPETSVSRKSDSSQSVDSAKQKSTGTLQLANNNPGKNSAGQHKSSIERALDRQNSALRQKNPLTSNLDGSNLNASQQGTNGNTEPSAGAVQQMPKEALSNTGKSSSGDIELRAQLATSERRIQHLQSTLNNLQQNPLPDASRTHGSAVTQSAKPHNRPSLFSKVRVLDSPRG